MIRALFHRYVPASLYGGQTAFAALARIDGELRHCDRLDAAVAAVDDLKNDLCARLQARFDQPPAQALALKAANLLLARRHFQRRSAVLRSRPFGLVIDPSNMCRLACPGCVHSERSESLQLFDWPSGTLSESRLAALLALYGPHAVAAYFCNYGEPLLNLNTPKLIRMAKRYLLTTMLSTSLSVQRFDADDYVRSGLDYMVLSIDGATQPVYQRFRRNGSLETVLGNIRSLLKARRALRKRTPVLSWNFLAFEHNAHEIPAAARMARDLGVDHFRVVEPFDVTWDDPEIRPAAVDAGVRRLSWSSVGIQPGNWNPFPETVDSASIARAFDSPWAEESADGEPASAGHTCHWLYKNMVMDATGRILPCCGGPRPDAGLVFGKFHGNGADPYNSPKYREARSFFRGAAPATAGSPHCVRCEWDHTAVNIGGPEIRRYFRAADAAFFDRRSLRILSDW